MAGVRDEEVFEGRVRAMVAAVERAAALVRDPTVSVPMADVPQAPSGSRAETLATVLGLDAGELDFVWSVVIRAVEPRVGAHLRAVFGSDARIGMSIAQHAAIYELPTA